MSSPPKSSPVPQEEAGRPYCSDPNCESCKDLRAVQEAIRLHLPLPQKEETIH
jgi:hypothetical protein